MNFRRAVVEDLEDLVAVQEAAAVVGLGHIFPQEEYPFPREAVLQRTGLATQLHDALLATFPSTLSRCRLRVFAENHRARQFYEKLWSTTGEATRSTFPPYAELVTYIRRLHHARAMPAEE